MDRRDAASSASNCAKPRSAMRPPTHSTERPRVDKANCPSSNTVFQGVPKPAKTAAGHCDAPSRTWTNARPQPNCTSASNTCAVQQSARKLTAKPRHVGRSVQCTWPGKAAASRLCAPPDRRRRPEPDHTVPVALPSCTRSPVALATASASQTAGANSTSATNKPSNPPQKAGHQGARCVCGVSAERGASAQRGAVEVKALGLRTQMVFQTNARAAP